MVVTYQCLCCGAGLAAEDSGQVKVAQAGSHSLQDGVYRTRQGRHVHNGAGSLHSDIVDPRQ